MTETIGMGAIPFAPRYVPANAAEDEHAALARIRKELDTDPPKKAIESKDGYDYLHSYYVFARANQVFGALNVAYLHRASKVLHTGTAKTRNGDRDYVVCEATAGVIITLPGDRVFYTEGTATCDGMGKGYGDAFTIAQKGAYSDARKIALRPLGKTFGSDFSIKDPVLHALEDRANIIERETKAAAKPANAPADHTPPPQDTTNSSTATTADPDAGIRTAWGKLYTAIEHVYSITEKEAKKQKARDLVTAEYPTVSLREITVAQIDSVRNILNRKADENAAR